MELLVLPFDFQVGQIAWNPKEPKDDETNDETNDGTEERAGDEMDFIVQTSFRSRGQPRPIAGNGQIVYSIGDGKHTRRRMF